MNADAASQLEPMQNPSESARVVGLRYVTDQMPGIRREKSGRGFRFRYATGDIVTDEQVLRRIKALAVPPAWTEIWICPDPCGHLQATGRDARGRKQSRYHRRWREIRDETKYARMIAFAKALPRIRRRVETALALPGLPRQKVLAAVVRLLEVSQIRVGNEEYARENKSFGLTTMEDRHVNVNGSSVKFQFRGKSGKYHEVDIQDRRLARIVKSCQDVPGQELFQYYDKEGNRENINSEDVNEYLKEIGGAEFTAKDFRTWAGTVLAARALREFQRFDSKAQAKKNIVQAIEAVAQRLGNTAAVCRKCYVHPEVINSYLDGTLLKRLKRRAEEQLATNLKSLPPEEAAVLALLQQRLAAEEKDPGGFAAELARRTKSERPRRLARRGRRA